ncbi:MAG: methyltransferase [Gemmatimonadota bacterium]|nr:MAG: methyltransferase [Gemmatimonadota bacterium]
MVVTDAHNIVADLAHLAVRTEDLVLDPRPHRVHPPEELAHLQASLSRYGQDQPLVVQRQGMIVRIGNGRLKAARALGWSHIAAIVLDADEATMIARGILDNRVADLAKNDADVIAELLADLQGIDTTLPVGFDDGEIARLLDRLDGVNGPVEEPPVDESPVSVEGIGPGTAWRMGDHALVCGDSGEEGRVAQAFELAGGPADQLLCDPPYGVGYGAKAGRRSIANDQGGQDYRVFFAQFLKLAQMAHKNTAYVFMSGQELHSLRLALRDAGFTWADYLIWQKNRMVLGRKDYNAAHEFVVYAWKGRHKFYGPPGHASTMLSFDRPVRSEDHPTMKPTDLLVRLMKDGSGPGALVYDPFLGSGSTLIAAEMAGRRCLGIELDPAYCAGTVRRWERFTGRIAERLE